MMVQTQSHKDRFFSSSQGLYLVLIAVSVVPVIIWLVYIQLMHEHLLHEEGRVLAMTGAGISIQLEREIAERVEDVKSLAAWAVIHRENLKAMEAMLRNSRQEHPEFLALNFTSIKGIILASSSRQLIGTDLGQHSLFRSFLGIVGFRLTKGLPIPGFRMSSRSRWFTLSKRKKESG